MKSKFKICLSALIVCLLFFAFHAFGETGFKNPLLNLNLSSEQISALSDVFEEYSNKQLQLQRELDRNVSELKMEMRKKDRFDTKSKDKETTEKSNQLVKEIGSIFGESIKATVMYLIESKNVFTVKQRELLFAGLQKLDFNLPDTLFGFTEDDLLSLDLGLSLDQRRQILKLQAGMQKKAIDISLDIDYNLMEMQMEVEKENRDPKKIDTLFLSVTDLVSEQIDMRVANLIKAKDVLTHEQKKKAQSLLFLQTNY